MRPGLPVAAVVGCALSAINEGGVILGGRAEWSTWVRVGLNFVVPFLVSSYGFLVASRTVGLPDGRYGGGGARK